MVKNLKVALFQTDLYWQDRAANLANLEEKIWSLKNPVDLVVLPEMFSTGFTMNSREMAEPMNFTTTRWMKHMAAQTGAVITGSVIINDSGKYFNRLLWVTPEGAVSHYDKKHLFRLANEDTHFDMGKEKIIVDLKGWKILPLICYDLRFPVWSRNCANSSGEGLYDLVFYIASWPASRIAAWDILLQARAIENLSYTIGVNRTGQDGNGVGYNGHSGVYDFKGQRLAFSPEIEEIITIELDRQNLLTYREKFPFWKDADEFSLDTK